MTPTSNVPLDPIESVEPPPTTKQVEPLILNNNRFELTFKELSQYFDHRTDLTEEDKKGLKNLGRDLAYFYKKRQREYKVLKHLAQMFEATEMPASVLKFVAICILENRPFSQALKHNFITDSKYLQLKVQTLEKVVE